MTPLSISPCGATPVRYGVATTLALAQAADRAACQSATLQVGVAAGPPCAGGVGATPGCGWFESSWDLQQGLAVSELPDRDGAAAALWFSALDGAYPVSACLQ
jgi:hypothetical protein